jgi:hypothetical protein
MTTALAWIAFALGALLCLTNFYLSFLSYPLHRLRGLPKESYCWKSGFPLFGSFCVGLSLFGLHTIPRMLPTAIVLIVIDTGGIHWFLVSIIRHSIYAKRHG